MSVYENLRGTCTALLIRIALTTRTEKHSGIFKSKKSEKFLPFVKFAEKYGGVASHLNPIGLITAKTRWSFGHSECSGFSFGCSECSRVKWRNDIC